MIVCRHIDRLRSLLSKVKKELSFISQPSRLAQAVTLLPYRRGS